MTTSTSFLGDLMVSIADRGRSLLGIQGAQVDPAGRVDVAALFEALLSGRGEASGVALAAEILCVWQKLDTDGRRAFLTTLAERFGPDQAKLDRAIESYRAEPSAKTIMNLHKAAEPRRQEVIRRLNLAPHGTEALVRIREELARHLKSHPDLEALDADFAHLFSSWFNRGFLVLRRIDWTTPANILEKIIRYEAVHTIRDWNDLRRRLEPSDRRCFAFFHPQLLDEPLIFVQVALAKEIPAAIGTLLAEDREPIAADQATTAVFYSISNTQKGLGGISFGNFLIKQVVEEMKQDLPNLQTFVTLSPVPGFAGWIARERQREDGIFDAAQQETLTLLDQNDWWEDKATVDRLREVMLPAAAYYFLVARDSRGRQIDPVARFHLGNGARLEQLNFAGDLSEKGLQQSHGLMVNYLYALDEIESNHETFAEKGTVVAAPAIRKLAKAPAVVKRQMA
jgi:malonyl-CoA decarboxylase